MLIDSRICMLVYTLWCVYVLIFILLAEQLNFDFYRTSVIDLKNIYNLLNLYTCE